MRVPRSTRAGFTMMEIMIVIAIILLVMAFAVPTINNYLRTRKLEACGRAIVGLLNEARSEAVSKRRNHYVVFLKQGAMLFASNSDIFSRVRGEEEGAAGMTQQGALRPFTKDEHIKCELRFAFPELEPGPENGAELPTELKTPGEGFDLSPTGDIVLTFTPTGTIDFGSRKDVPNEQYVSSAGGDIVVHQDANPLKGLIDIRPAGTVAFKIPTSVVEAP